jgi:putative DNA primase/helicase
MMATRQSLPPSDGSINPFLGSALEYAKNGWPVLPLAIKGKIPLIKGGKGSKDATTDLQQIEGWWSKTPNANVGIATGLQSGIFVLDVDIGKDGEESLQNLQEQYGALPVTHKVKTGTGGWHYYFYYPPNGIKNSASKLGSGLDIRGDGGYVVAPPSIHPDTGNPYEWECKDPIVAAPDWLFLALAETSNVISIAKGGDSIAEGQRNEFLTSIAGKFRREGLEEEEIGEVLLSINGGRCDPPLPEKEVLGIAKSISKYFSEGGFPLSDMGNAERLVARHGGDLHYCYPWKSWLIWDGKRWKPDETGQIMRLAKETVRSIKDEAASIEDAKLKKKVLAHARSSEGRAKLESTIALALPELAIQPDDLDIQPWLLNLQNGTLDLRIGELREHQRDDFLMKMVPVTYDAAAKCETWYAFLRKIMNGNEALVGFLQRLIGYSLTGVTTEQSMYVLYGSGANGKSTFLETIHALLGEYGKKTETRTLIQRENEGVRNDLARLKGARFVSAVEVARGQRLNEVLVKEVTGDDKIVARFLFKEHFEFSPEFKLFLACNHKPEIRGTDEAIWRRLNLIPFNVFIPAEERDKELLSKLKKELPGILNWALDGLRQWQADGLQTPEEVVAATNSYRQEMDILSDFLNHVAVIDPEKEVAAGELFRSYEEWCEENGEQAVKLRTFGVMMKERGFPSVVKTRNNKTLRVYVGIQLTF